MLTNQEHTPLCATAPYNPTQEAAATTIQRVWRGHRVRQRTLLPGQLLPFLDHYLVTSFKNKELSDLELCLCREVNSLSLEPDKFKGKSRRLAPSEKEYAIATPSNSRVRHVRPDFLVWLEMAKDGQSLDLLMVPSESQISALAEGSYKRVFRAREFHIPFQISEGKRLVQARPMILFEAIGKRKHVEKGIILQRSLLRLPGVKLAELPHKRLPSTDIPATESPFEAKQRWYPCSLAHAVDKGTLPLDVIPEAPTVNVSLVDLMSALVDVARSLEAFLEAGISHCDVKPDNILLSRCDSGKIEGILSDFDLTCHFGSHFKSDYCYWDPAARDGWITPCTDAYGLAMSLGEVLLPGFLSHENTLDKMKVSPESTSFPFQILDSAVTARVKKSLSNTSDKELLRLCQIDTAAKMEAALTKFLQKKDLDPASRKTAACLVVEVEVMTSSFKLIMETVKKSKNMHQWLKERPDLQQWLNGTSSQKKKAIRILSLICPSVKQLRQPMEQLAAKLKATAHE